MHEREAVKNKSDFVIESNSICQAELLSGAHLVSDAMVKLGHRPLAVAELTKADEEAGKKLFEVANTSGLVALQEHIDENPPNACTIAFLLVVAQGQAKSELSSKNASKRARSARKEGCKNLALVLWRDWQSNPDCYKNKSAFCKNAIHKIASEKNRLQLTQRL